MSPGDWDRRDFLRAAGCSALLLAGGAGVRAARLEGGVGELLDGTMGHSTHRNTVRMGWLLPTENPAPPRGAEAGMVLGWEEAEQVGTLLGVVLDVRVERVGTPQEVDAAGARLMAEGVQVMVGAVDAPPSELVRRISREGVPFVQALAWSPRQGRPDDGPCGSAAFRVGIDEATGMGLVLEALMLGAPAGPTVLVGDPADPQMARARVALAQRRPEPRILDASLPADRITDGIRAAGPSDQVSVLLVGPSALAWAFEPGAEGAAPTVYATTPLQSHAPPPTRPLHTPALWHPGLVRFGAAQINERYERRFGDLMDPPAWAGWFAVKLLWEAALRARSRGGEAAPLQALDAPSTRFDGHKGVGLGFRADGHLRQPLYLVRTDPQGESTVVHEGPAVASGTPFAAAFDALGPPGSDCRSGSFAPHLPAPPTSWAP